MGWLIYAIALWLTGMTGVLAWLTWRFFKRYLTATAPIANLQDPTGLFLREFWTLDANPMLLTKSQELMAVWRPFPGTAAWSLDPGAAGRYAGRTQAYRYPASLIPQ